MTDLIVTSAHWSEAGRKPENEDACGICLADPDLRRTKGVAAVIADGMSGSEGGMEASYACVEGFLNDYFSTPESWSVKSSGQKVLAALNRWLHSEGHQRYGSSHGMVATLSALVVKSRTAYLFHLGDTRIYRFRNGDVECLTRDHRIQVRSETHCLSRAMGIEINLQIDYRTIPVEQGDLFLMITDGIHDYLTDDDIMKLVLQHGVDLTKACQTLVSEALARGSMDNVTSLMARVEQLPAQDKHEFYHQLTVLPFPPPLVPGMSMDGYRIIREVHASKRSELFLAFDEETNTQVLLKVPSINYEDDPTYIDLFLHESWIGKRLDNPHVVKILDHARSKTFLYTVLEHVEGQTLRQWMSDHPQPPLQDVRNIVEQIAIGLCAFHRKEMIHQDLKPENIMIDRFGYVKIIDFGSTKVAGVEEIATPIERPYMLGTANYTAPEYLQGYAGSERSDIFSLGVLTYEMLTGTLPYGPEPTVGKINSLAYTPGYQHNPAIPVWMDGALEKAVHPNPADRYEVLSEFTYDLSHPNPKFLREKPLALLERDPIGFWRWMAMILFLINVILLYLLSK
ncbi:MAG TPA: bifunctional protein-serine/threonine kinase/phosphatase [Nitrospirales bacterium]|nr:bifunctional protein-serine/threonine kinase/phosphatase [Nitrospirales bacterium]